MENILYEFTKEELRRLSRLSWQKLLQEALPLSKRINGCEYCQKLNTPLVFKLEYSYIGKKVPYYYLAFFCSVHCFQQWRRSGKKLFRRELDETNVRQRILYAISDHSLKELRIAKNFNFKAAIRKKILNYEKSRLCDFCHIKPKAGYCLYSSQPGKKSINASFCSEECMVKIYNDKKLQRRIYENNN